MYTNMVNGTIGICRSEGFGGIYRGLGPTVSSSPCAPLRIPYLQLHKHAELVDHETRRQLSRPLRLILHTATDSSQLYTTGKWQTIINADIWYRRDRGLDHCLCVYTPDPLLIPARGRITDVQTRQCPLTTLKPACSPPAQRHGTGTAWTACKKSSGKRASSDCGAARHRGWRD